MVQVPSVAAASGSVLASMASPVCPLCSLVIMQMLKVNSLPTAIHE